MEKQDGLPGIGIDNPKDGLSSVPGKRTVIVGGDKFETISPDDARTGSAGHTDSEPKRKRGRPKGSGSGSSTKTGSKDSLHIVGTAPILLSIHAMLAGMLKTPELELDPSEAKLLGDAAENVMKHYDVTASAKTIAWVNLAMICGQVYGPRIFAMQMRKRPVASVHPLHSSGQVINPQGPKPVN